jgi:DNA-binding Lrp family transcriptional regulator
MMPNAIELSLLDRWQRDFPLVTRPFAHVGQGCSLSETATVDVFRRLLATDVLSRIGAVVRPHTVGASTLAALQVPPERLEDVADMVSREPCVSHNYARAHDFNLWFVVAGPNSETVADTIARIERRSGLEVMRLPLVEAYHVDLGFALVHESRSNADTRISAEDCRPDSHDRRLLAVIEDGLPIVAQPYGVVADRLRWSEADVLQRLRRLIASGVIARFGCVVRHRALGYVANAMAVWDIPDERIGAAGRLLAGTREVTLCYRRPRRPPDWPYNLFCMIHARTREEASAAIERVKRSVGVGVFPHDVLYSTRCFKQRGARFSHPNGAAL